MKKNESQGKYGEWAEQTAEEIGTGLTQLEEQKKIFEKPKKEGKKRSFLSLVSGFFSYIGSLFSFSKPSATAVKKEEIQTIIPSFQQADNHTQARIKKKQSKIQSSDNALKEETAKVQNISPSNKDQNGKEKKGFLTSFLSDPLGIKETEKLKRKINSASKKYDYAGENLGDASQAIRDAQSNQGEMAKTIANNKVDRQRKVGR